jgi:chemosensory pili system protein ChpA (sensor histidine kinase/response regulator)
MLALGFARIGNDIVVRCEDDGAGLDYAAIESVARNRGLLEGTQSPSEEQLKATLMQPGFSTRSETTQTSGRGIGMAAVAARVGELKGTIGLSSAAGRGCIVELKIPVSLISVAGVLVSVRGRTVAVANRGIEHMAAQATTDGASCRIDGRGYSAIVLADSLYGPVGAWGEQAHCAALVVGDGARSRAVLVDEIIETRNFVVKGLGDYVPPVHGLLGATLLGDGAVVPVLDLLDWMAAPEPETVMADAASYPTAFPPRHRILIVDDSISTRRSLSQLLGDAGYEFMTAADGLDALDRMAAASPNLLVVDLEMPRMNGLELTRHLRAAENGAELPIIMVTSRSTDKHRREAGEAGVDIYLTKPYSEDSLLDAVETLLAGRDAAAKQR